MSDLTDSAAPAAASNLVIRPRRRAAPLHLGELWRYRELFLILAWRDVAVRYKQTALGVIWAVLQPIMTMVVFTVIFGRLAKMGSNGVPYAIMTYVAVLPWNYFSSCFASSTSSVVGASGMVSKVYFPRLIIPASTAISGLVDFAIAFLILFGLMLWYHVGVTVYALLLPAFLLMAMLAALGAGLWLSALNVKYRDVKHLIPFVVRIGTYVSPVGFMSSVVPEKWRMLYCLNPMVGVIDGFRWAILGASFQPYRPGFCASATIVLVLFISGLYYFRSVETTFADNM